MKAFLEYVAEDIIKKYGTNLSNIAVVFPNKRASLFLNQYLLKIVKKPIWSPRYITISELFRSKSDLIVADNIKAVSVLYKIFENRGMSFDSIDRFWGWGEMVLADFDDIDKNMANANLVFSNTRDLHAYDTVNYLKEEQIKELQKFFVEFTDDHESKLKTTFEKLWNRLFNIYTDFNAALRQQHLAYEGALYREVAENAEKLDWPHSKYLFVGFNMIQKAEETLFSALKNKGLAHFYWDFDNYYIGKDNQKAGIFIDKFSNIFSNEFDEKNEEIYNNFSSEKNIAYLSASSENIQARYVNQWLKEKGRLNNGERTAIVLADESLLKSVIHYLPEETMGRVNITLGYPLFQAPITSFVENFFSLHIYGYKTEEQLFFIRQVDYLLLHPYTQILSENAPDISAQLHEERKFFPKCEDICKDEATKLLFEPINESDSEMTKILLDRLLKILKMLGERSEQIRKENVSAEGKDYDAEKPTYEEQFMQESVFKMYNIINRLKDLICNEDIDIKSFLLLRLIDQIIRQTSMPLHGEPAVGLQIMGVLETRNLDFDHVLLLSCNEGNMPKGVSDSSIIPYIVRKSYDLTTNDNKAAIYAYYFYRLLQRCPDVSIAYNSSTDEGQTGQMSRFMTQIMAETNPARTHISHFSLTASQMPSESESIAIKKTEEAIKILKERKSLSPSAINTYLRCQLRFYFQYVAGLKEPDSDSIDDNRNFGNIFHAAAESIYKNISDINKKITKQAINLLLEEKGNITIAKHVDDAFSAEMFGNRKPKYDGLMLINRDAIIILIRKLLKADKEIAPFTIVGLEKDVYEKFSFDVKDQKNSIIIGGRIDRIDRVKPVANKEILRVVDYKTGSSLPKKMPDVEAIFSSEKISDHSDYYLQTMLYSIILRHMTKPITVKDKEFPPLNKANEAVKPFLLFIQKSENQTESVLKIGNRSNTKEIDDIADYEDEFRENLKKLLEEIFNPDIDFQPTDKKDRCKTCPYARLCKGVK
jgi:CRISPR/Cas system-associated exonuclease Cas4 (RecB family)